MHIKTSRKRLGLMIGAAAATVAAGVAVFPTFAGAAEKDDGNWHFTITVGKGDGSVTPTNATTVKLVCNPQTGKAVSGTTHPHGNEVCATIKRNGGEFYPADNRAADQAALDKCNAQHLRINPWVVLSQKADSVMPIGTTTGYNNTCELLAIEGVKAQIGQFTNAKP